MHTSRRPRPSGSTLRIMLILASLSVAGGMALDHGDSDDIPPLVYPAIPDNGFETCVDCSGIPDVMVPMP